jgi:hypothetical protein
MSKCTRVSSRSSTNVKALLIFFGGRSSSLRLNRSDAMEFSEEKSETLLLAVSF